MVDLPPQPSDDDDGEVHPLRRHARMLAGGLFFLGLLLVACVLWIPKGLYPPLTTGDLEGVSDAAKIQELVGARLKLQNDARTTLLQGLGALVVLTGAAIGASVTLQQVQTTRAQVKETAKASQDQLRLSEQGQVTERFTRAIDQLGNTEALDVRLGGIYALERIARDSSADRPVISEILTAYVRGHAPRLTRSDAEQPDEMWVIEVLPPLQLRAPDIQAAMTVLDRGGFADEQVSSDDLVRGRLDFRSVNLSNGFFKDANFPKASFGEADLQEADFSGAKLRGTHFWLADLRRAIFLGADLKGATFLSANLQKAYFTGANLLKASLEKAKLQAAWFESADLQNAWLDNADLQVAWLGRAKLQGARLEGANLQGAGLSSADLQGAWLNGANLQGTYLFGANLQGTGLSGTNLQGALASEDTRWPEGFDPKDAGVEFPASIIRRMYKWVKFERKDLSGQDLSRADLSAANLYGVNLRGANLSGAMLNWADLRGADLTGADLTGAKFTGTLVNFETKWPKEAHP